ncbi:unnamed protein product [Calicophoron daubneyi]|uniref:ETS domain-containing protein n=1 Tax=Calicophoron daubneyi TaxID=300641 RepID=A0AAV2TKC8_CALDB
MTVSGIKEMDVVEVRGASLTPVEQLRGSLDAIDYHHFMNSTHLEFPLAFANEKVASDSVAFSDVMLNHICPDDLFSNPGWHSHSPSSSESTESYPSCSSSSPLDTEFGQQNIHSLQNTGHVSQYSPFLTFSQFLESSDQAFQVGSQKLQQDELEDSPFLFNEHHEIDILPEENGNHTPLAFHTSTCRSRSPSPDIASGLDRCDLDENEIGSVSGQPSITDTISDRPSSLKIAKPGDSNKNDASSPSPNLISPVEFEEQLASVDIAWMGALDIPNLCLEEIDRILSSTNNLQNSESPECLEECKSNVIDQPINASPTTQKELRLTSGGQEKKQCVWRKKRIRSIIQNCKIYQTNRMSLKTPPQCDGGSAAVSHNQVNRFVPRDEVSRTGEAADSDSTLTCSEAEYYCNRIRDREEQARRRKTYMKRRYSPRLDFDSDSDSDLDEAAYICTKYSRRRRSDKCNLSIKSVSKFSSYRKSQNPQLDAEIKPWWPRGCALMSGCTAFPPSLEGSDLEDESTLPPNADKEGINSANSPSSTIHDSEMGGLHIPDTPDPLDPSDIKCKKRLRRHFGELPAKKCASEEWNATNALWPSRRRRKQLELWQFILYRLESSEKSAFQWVNRPAGVFRIVDTQAGAKEWGSYRGNSRMDYEKMARAMRFYYKDAILRKVRQQLHFQFAMPYVQWARKFHRTKN